MIAQSRADTRARSRIDILFSDGRGAGLSLPPPRPLEPLSLPPRSCGTFGPHRKAAVGGASPSASARPLFFGARFRPRHGGPAGIRMLQYTKSTSNQGWPGPSSGAGSINGHLRRGKWEARMGKGETHSSPSPSTKKTHVSAIPSPGELPPE